MQSKEYEMLRHSRLFKYIDEPQFKQIMHCMQPKLQKYEKGETIISDGDAFLYYYVLIHGSASVYKFEYSGERVLIKRVSPGGIIGMIPASSPNELWPFTIIAQEDCVAMLLNSALIASCKCSFPCKAYLVFIDNLITAIMQEYTYLYQRIRYLAMKSVRQKVCAYLVEQWERHDNMTFNIELNRQDVADLLSIPRSSLSRELCRLRDDGLISFYKYTFKIHNLFQLQKYANNTEQ